MSLTREVVDLYKRGLIREEAMEHAVKEASAVRSKAEIDRRIKMAALRAEVFGAITPSLIKSASMKVLMERAAPIAAVMAGAGGVNALSNVVQRFRDAKEFASSYDVMVKKNPELKGSAGREHFEVLKQFAPVMAKNPTVAAGYVSQAMEMGGVMPMDTVHKLTQTQKTYQDAQNKGLISGALDSVTGAIGGILSGGLES